MAYAPTKTENEVASVFVIGQKLDDVTSLNPILQSWEAAANGEAPSIPLVMTDEEREGRRSILNAPGPPSKKLLVVLAERRRLKRAANEI